MGTKTKFAIRSVRYREAEDCLEQYLQDYNGVIRTGYWTERMRDRGETTSHKSIEDSWVEVEMLTGHLPTFMLKVGHPVILDLELPEIRTRRNKPERALRHLWAIWTGPPRPAYQLTIYDGYRE